MFGMFANTVLIYSIHVGTQSTIPQVNFPSVYFNCGSRRICHLMAKYVMLLNYTLVQ
jgi:hypothetical protein